MRVGFLVNYDLPTRFWSIRQSGVFLSLRHQVVDGLDQVSYASEALPVLILNSPWLSKQAGTCFLRGRNEMDLQNLHTGLDSPAS